MLNLTQRFNRVWSLDSFSPLAWYPLWPLHSLDHLPWIWQDVQKTRGIREPAWPDAADLSLVVSVDGLTPIPESWLDDPTPGILATSDRILAVKVLSSRRPEFNASKPSGILRELAEWLAKLSTLPVRQILAESLNTLHDARAHLLHMLQKGARPMGVQRRGDLAADQGNNLWLGRDVTIEPGVFLDSRHGPIVIESGSSVRPFSYLVGPLYVGPNCQLDHVRLSESWIGPTCRLGGEVDTTWMLGFSNKHHDGFLGHAYVGSWCNLGAATTVSDLKNTYGEVQVMRWGTPVDTGKIKVGPMLSDHVRTGIGTLINTGTVIGPGSMLLADDGLVSGEIPPFSWRHGARRRHYALGKLSEHIQTMMSRRGETLDKADELRLAALHSESWPPA